MELRAKIAECIKSRITKAVHIKPCIINCFRYCTRKILYIHIYIPSAPDGACSHIGKVTQILNMPKKAVGSLIQKDWSPREFEELADSIDKEDNAISVDKLKELERLHS